MRVAFYGGSFNPPHVAHVMAASYLLGVAEFERVLVVPVYAHAFNKPLTPFADRLRMCELAMGWLPQVQVCDVESSLAAPSWTLRSLEHVARQHPDYQLRLVIGADVLQDTQNWHAFEQVTRLAPPFVLGRVGFADPAGAPPVLPDVSSTRIRRLLAQRDAAVVQHQLRSLVAPSVLRYIEEHDLYRGLEAAGDLQGWPGS
jgi:nicotinate-nucleotide adenylyltransferase